MCLKEESVCGIEMSQGIMPYQIHSILLLLVIWHPSLVSLHSQRGASRENGKGTYNFPGRGSVCH